MAVSLTVRRFFAITVVLPALLLLAIWCIKHEDLANYYLGCAFGLYIAWFLLISYVLPALRKLGRRNRTQVIGVAPEPLCGAEFDVMGDPLYPVSLNEPEGLLWDERWGVVIADTGNHCLISARADVARPLAGQAGVPGFVDGVGEGARFDSPCVLARGPDESLYVLDRGNRAVRVIDATGRVSTLWRSPEGDDLPLPSAMCSTSGGKICYVLHGSLYRIREDGTATVIRPEFRDTDKLSPTRLLAGPDGLFLGRSGLWGDEIVKILWSGKSCKQPLHLVEGTRGSPAQVMTFSDSGALWSAPVDAAGKVWLIECMEGDGKGRILRIKLALAKGNGKPTRLGLRAVRAMAVAPSGDVYLAAENNVWCIRARRRTKRQGRNGGV